MQPIKTPPLIADGQAFDMLNGKTIETMAGELNNALDTCLTATEWTYLFMFPNCVPPENKEAFYLAMDEMLLWFLQYQTAIDNNPAAIELINKYLTQHEKIK